MYAENFKFSAALQSQKQSKNTCTSGLTRLNISNSGNIAYINFGNTDTSKIDKVFGTIWTMNADGSNLVHPRGIMVWLSKPAWQPFFDMDDYLLSGASCVISLKHNHPVGLVLSSIKTSMALPLMISGLPPPFGVDLMEKIKV
jgi:hypothetical protein